MLMSVERSYFTLVFFKAACHANPGIERTFFLEELEFLNTAASNNSYNCFEHTNHDFCAHVI